MNILFVIGNGFDVSLGLKTGYQDFYDYYLKQPSENEVIKKLKDYLHSARYDTWADLELGLGMYTAEVTSIDKMRCVYYDLSDRLKEYLKDQENAFTTTDSITSAITSGLLYPHAVLPIGVTNAINTYRSGMQPYLIDIISFNYTNTLEKVLKPILVDKDQTQLNKQTVLRSIKHIHMNLVDTDVIMGVNDDSQILNKDFLNDELRRLLVKPYINQQLQNLVDTECLRLIQNADLICLFGVSVGETDLMWWQAIGDRLQKSPLRILFYAYDKDTAIRNDEIIGKYAEYKSLLFSRMGISEPSEDQKARVFVGYKTRLFKV